MFFPKKITGFVIGIELMTMLLFGNKLKSTKTLIVLYIINIARSGIELNGLLNGLVYHKLFGMYRKNVHINITLFHI